MNPWFKVQLGRTPEKILNYWLMKSEPDEFSIDDLVKAPKQTTPWFGVRNYVARNFMRDTMRVGDGVLFYHSSCPEPGIAGLAKVSSPSYPDESQFDRKSPYYDPKATRETPRWMLVDVKLDRKTRLMPLGEMRSHKALEKMVTLKRGNRLSITPVTPAQWNFIVKKLDG